MCFKKGHFNNVSRLFKESFHWVSRVFEKSSKGSSEKFQRHFKDILRKFQGRVSRKIQGCFNEVLSGFQKYLIEVV